MTASCRGSPSKTNRPGATISAQFQFPAFRLTQLIVEYQSPPRDPKCIWNDMRNLTAYWTFWIVMAIFFLTLVFGIIASVLRNKADRSFSWYHLSDCRVVISGSPCSGGELTCRDDVECRHCGDKVDAQAFVSIMYHEE